MIFTSPSFYEGKGVSLPSIKHFTKCVRISSCLYACEPGEIPCTIAVALAIANKPQSLVPDCMCMSMMLIFSSDLLLFEVIRDATCCLTWKPMLLYRLSYTITTFSAFAPTVLTVSQCPRSSNKICTKSSVFGLNAHISYRLYTCAIILAPFSLVES